MITDQSPLAFADPLPEAVDVVVIGAGIVGTSTAYFLAEGGLSVLLCEKGRVAGEQSSRNWGWIRQQGRDWAELPIMMESNRIWQGLAAKTGERDLTFTQAGCLYLAQDQAGGAKYETWRDLAKQHQLDTKMLTPAELKDRFPAVGDGWAAAMVTETDGRAEPFVAIPALARAAQALGARIAETCAVRSVDKEGGRITGVVTEKGRVRCGKVVLAGGAWSTVFAANAGVDLPQLTVRSSVTRSEPAPEILSGNVSTPGLTLRRRDDGGYTLASGDLAEHYVGPKSFRYASKFLNLLKVSAKDLRIWPAPPKGYPGAWGSASRWGDDEVTPFERTRVLNPPASPTAIRRVKERLPQRFPQLKDLKLAEAWAGMIDVTPDAVPTLGEDPALPGLFIATGCSGHGFGIGPALGRITADLLCGRPAGHDLERFRPTRFRDGSKIVPGPY